jgi:hypothetical protein
MAAWECPDCGLVKNVVCPVCGEDKTAGETCASCGSEYSHTSCPECGGSQWHEPSLTAGSYHEKIKEILKSRDGKYITYYELMRLVAHYEPESLPKICLNDPIDVKNISSAAFRLKGSESLNKWCELKGVTERLANEISKLLREAIDEGSDQH